MGICDILLYFKFVLYKFPECSCGYVLIHGRNGFFLDGGFKKAIPLTSKIPAGS